VCWLAGWSAGWSGTISWHQPSGTPKNVASVSMSIRDFSVLRLTTSSTYATGGAVIFLQAARLYNDHMDNPILSVLKDHPILWLYMVPAAGDLARLEEHLHRTTPPPMDKNFIYKFIMKESGPQGNERTAHG
jgi:hypothetical protein